MVQCEQRWQSQIDLGVLEVVENHQGETYRAVYTVNFSNLVYVLHAFEKKSKKGIATPKSDLDLINRRLQAAEQDHKVRQAARGSKK